MHNIITNTTTNNNNVQRGRDNFPTILSTRGHYLSIEINTLATDRCRAETWLPLELPLVSEQACNGVYHHPRRVLR